MLFGESGTHTVGGEEKDEAEEAQSAAGDGEEHKSREISLCQILPGILHWRPFLLLASQSFPSEANYC